MNQHNFLQLVLDIFQTKILDLDLFYYLIFFVFFLFAILLNGVFAKFIVQRIKFIVNNTTNKIDDNLYDALIPPFKLLPLVLIFLILTIYFDREQIVGIYFQKISTSLVTIFIFWLMHQLLIPFSFLFEKLELVLSKALTLWVVHSIKYLIIILGVIAILETWGIKIGPIIAGLGLLGVAVALGAQDVFKNLISGIMILMEKRFQIGDIISVQGHTEGVVEQIGFRSTLIRKFDSTPITLPNYVFAEAPILNFSKRKFRRINWTIGLEYSSKLVQIDKFTKSIYNYIVNNRDFIVNDQYKSFVKLDKFNDSSIDILIYCFTSTNEWDEFLKIKEKLALFIKDEVEKNNLTFAFPSQSIYIENLDQSKTQLKSQF